MPSYHDHSDISTNGGKPLQKSPYMNCIYIYIYIYGTKWYLTFSVNFDYSLKQLYQTIEYISILYWFCVSDIPTYIEFSISVSDSFSNFQICGIFSHWSYVHDFDWNFLNSHIIRFNPCVHWLTFRYAFLTKGHNMAMSTRLSSLVYCLSVVMQRSILSRLPLSHHKWLKDAVSYWTNHNQPCQYEAIKCFLCHE